MRYASEYGVDVSPPPAKKIKIARAFSTEIMESGEVKTDHSAAYNELEVPAGYTANEFQLRGTFDKHGGKAKNSRIGISIGDQQMFEEWESGENQPNELKRSGI